MVLSKALKQSPTDSPRVEQHFLKVLPLAMVLMMTAAAFGQSSPPVYYWSWDPADALVRVEAQSLVDESGCSNACFDNAIGAFLWPDPDCAPPNPPPLFWHWSILPPVPPPAPPVPLPGPPVDWDEYPPQPPMALGTIFIGDYCPCPTSDEDGNPPPPVPLNPIPPVLPMCALDWDLRVNYHTPIGLVFQNMLEHASLMPDYQLTNEVFSADGDVPYATTPCFNGPFFDDREVSGFADQVVTLRDKAGLNPSVVAFSDARTWEIRLTNYTDIYAFIPPGADRFVGETCATIVTQVPLEIAGLTPGVPAIFTLEIQTQGAADHTKEDHHYLDAAFMLHDRPDADNAYGLASVNVYTEGFWATQLVDYVGDPPGFAPGTFPSTSAHLSETTFAITPTSSTYPIVLRLTSRVRTHIEDDPQMDGVDEAFADMKLNVLLTVFSPPAVGQLEAIPAGGPGPNYSFWMSKFEVTNQEFVDFLNDAEKDAAAGGTEKSEFMMFDATTGQVHTPGGELLFDPIDTPVAGGGTLQKIRYRPGFAEGTRYVVDVGAEPDAVVGVTWIGALKYCNWLTLHMGYPPSDRCYTEGDTIADWHPVTTTAAQWAAGDLTDAQRADLVANYRGFRLPMDNLRSATGYIDNQVNDYNEWYKASAYDPSAPNTTRTGPGGESVPPMHWTYGFGRDNIGQPDANYLNSGDVFDDGVARIGYFDGVNVLPGGTPTNDTDNFFGLYDLAGNVAEWGQDQTANGRALRTGSWQETAGETAAARRDEADPGTISSEIGFRVVTTHEPPQPCASSFPACPADLDGDGLVNAADLLELLADWDSDVSCADLDQSGNVSTPDLLMLLANWGMCPGATSFAYDSGATDLSLGLTSDGVIGWLHRFDAGSGNVIENIATTYGTPALGGQTGVSPGDPVGYAILTDTGNGPGDVIWMGQDAIDVNAIGNDGLQVLPVPDIPVAGNFYIAAWVEVPANTYPAPMDQTVVMPDDVWLFGELGATFSDFDPQNPGFVFNMDDEGFPTVWMLRANE